MPSLTDKIVLITGASTGIGQATAVAFAREGATVVLAARSEERLQQVSDEIEQYGRPALVLPVDVADRDGVFTMMARIMDSFGRIDILINNAGMTQTGVDTPLPELFHKLPFLQWQREFDLNLNTCFHVTRAVLPHMLQTGYGRIVNIASVTGPLVTFPGTAGYSAAKSGMVGLTRAVAHEVAGQGITVNAVAPGWIATHSSQPEEIQAGLHTPVGRAGKPEEIARVVVFLASEGCSYLTGQMLVVDGGNSLQEIKG